MSNELDKIIKIDDIEGKVYELDNWKPEQGNQVKKYFNEKILELKRDYNKLVDDFKWNKIIFESEITFVPVIGKTYYLYKKENGKKFMSLIEPSSWSKSIKIKFIGSFMQDSRQKWNLIDTKT
ncbi:MAG: hypothetical protein CBD58_02235 [bacterium TMED198]|nr:MAG: hypothetical protein CBD58_02235 [bacterium TMED198]